jgi:hypothetical protein
MCACMCPQVLPHPINTQVPLALPGAPAEAASVLEDQLLLQGLLTAHITARKSQPEGCAMLPCLTCHDGRTEVNLCDSMPACLHSP